MINTVEQALKRTIRILVESREMLAKEILRLRHLFAVECEDCYFIFYLTDLNWNEIEQGKIEKIGKCPVCGGFHFRAFKGVYVV